MSNAWKVQWRTEGRKLVKTFEGDKPSESGALDFAKGLKNQGITDVALISKRRAFAPPAGSKPPQVGYLWCPFCVRWREFDTYSIRFDGITGPARYRCITCTISTDDAAVRRYNAGRVRHKELEEEVKSQVQKGTRRRGNNLPSVRRS